MFRLKLLRKLKIVKKGIYEIFSSTVLPKKIYLQKKKIIVKSIVSLKSFTKNH